MRNSQNDASTTGADDRYFFHLAIAEAERKELARATELVRRAIALRPFDGRYWRALGELLSMRELHTDALAAFEHAYSVQGPSAEIHFSMAAVLNSLGRKSEASDHFGRSVVLAPEWPEAWFNHGMLLLQLKRPEEALAALQKAVDLRPAWTDGWLHVGLAQLRKDFFEAAAASFEKALYYDPSAAMAHMHFGICQQRLGRVADAAASYRRALSLQPEYAEAWFNLGDALHLQGSWDEAIDCYNKAIAINPKKALPYFNLALVLRRKGCIGEALVHCSKALAVDPNFAAAKVYLLQLAQHACDWTLADQMASVVDQLSTTQIRQNQKPAEIPLLSLRRHADPEKNLAIAKAWSHAVIERVRLMSDRSCFKHLSRAERRTIRVGYISNDFKDHAVAYHILGLLRAHRRDRFRIYLYACNPQDDSAYRKKTIKTCDHFIDLHGLSDTVAAQRIYDDRIDILVDLMGHTRGCRLEILAMRPAPVQVGYLGFLGSSGAPFIDYFLTDAVVTPPAHAAYYTEKLVYLPGCYQVNDDQMSIAKPVNRASFGLREDQLVLCCFNQPYKIDRKCFQAWLAILNKVPKAVLWLLGHNASARENLCRAATQAGIASDRLIFAGPLRLDHHLARLRLADLALDTFSYNGGATTANALWAGVPVLTLMGNHFVSRMSASALVAVGLPEMITHSTGEYIEKAIDLLSDRSRVAKTRAKLESLKKGSSLFDPHRFSAHIEAAFEKMLGRFDAGKPPVSFSIESKIDPATA